MNKTLIWGAGLALTFLAGATQAQTDHSGANQAILNAGGSHASEDSTLQFNTAVDDYNAKRDKAATAEITEYLKQNPKNVEAHKILADLDIRQNKITDAIPELETIVKLAPKDTVWRNNLGSAYLQTNQFDKATALYKSLHDQKPKDPESAYYWGVSLTQAGKYAEAVPVLQNAVALKPTAPAYLQLGVALDKSGKHTDAAKAFQSAAALAPKDAQAPLFAGLMYQQTGDNAQAITSLKQALALGTQNPFTAHMALAAAYAATGKTAQAIGEYTQAATVSPEDFSAQANLGVLNQNSGKSAEAEAAYRKALTLKADDPKTTASVQSNLALLLISQNKLDEGATLLTQAAAGDPTNAHIPFNLGIVYEKQNKPELAKDAYQKALAIDPSLTEAKQNLAQISK